MKNILGIIGSPRKLGNSEIITKEIAAHVSVPYELNLLRLADFNILNCRGCYLCLFGEKRCNLKDDLYDIIDAMCKADAIILAAPVYCLGVTAVLKQFVDRSLALYAHIDQLWGKPSVGACIAGIEGKEGYGLLGVESFLKFAMTDIKLTKVIYGALPGEALQSQENQSIAVELGNALFGPAPTPIGPKCPLCGGDTFRFIGDLTVRCMLCSNKGKLDLSSGEPVIRVTPSDHEFFLTKSDAAKHKAWLMGMKSRFKESKPSLKPITQKYRKQGNWIRASEKINP